jgi:NADH-quinone oxidoreductase subunit N
MTPVLLAAAHIKGPHIDWKAFSPLLCLSGGGLIVLLVGLFRPAVIREKAVPALAVIAFACTIAACIWRFHHTTSIISGALRMDNLALELDMLFSAAGIATVLMSWRAVAPRESGHGEYFALLLFSAFGMAVFVSAQNLVTLFLGIELLSIPLYILCASETRRESSLESGLKYLIVGSVGSATLVYGLALVYGATGSTDFAAIGHAMSLNKFSGGVLGNAMVLTGLGLTIVGFAFKASVAPFHQWTPDVYEGAPTPVTAFMAVTTKVAALGVFLRFFDVALTEAHASWGPAVAALAAITIVVGNVGALGQSSLKRMLAYSSVAQAGYMLAGVVVASQLGVQATVLYLIVYLLMNMAAFAVIVARERESGFGDSIQALTGLGRERPWLAWPMTLSMLGLAGIPATAGFIGKFYLIDAAVSGGYTWLGVVIVVGSMISLGYYLPVIAAMWMRDAPAPSDSAALSVRPDAAAGPLPALAGGSPELDAESSAANGTLTVDPNSQHTSGVQPEVAFVAILAGAAIVFFGVIPQPLFDLVHQVGTTLGLL